MSEDKIYRGKILSIVRVGITAFGVRQYKVSFKSGDALYEISGKRTMPFEVGSVISFKGEWYFNTFFITEVKDEIYVHTIRSQEKEEIKEEVIRQ